MKFSLSKCTRAVIVTSVLFFATWQCQAQEISRNLFAETLMDGGYVIVMRHASSPRQPPDAATVNADNVNAERQLDDTGRRDATAMGEALRRLMIPVDAVLSSPAYRAMETARRMGYEELQIAEELSNEGMQATGAEKADWLRDQAGTPTGGGNRLLITHGPNISAAFADHSQGMTEGEALIFDPRGMEAPVMIHRIRIGDWNSL